MKDETRQEFSAANAQGACQMTTCCDYGKCTNGPDCPVRKQRIKEVNDAYTHGYNDARLDDPYEDVIGTFKSLLIVLAVCIAATLLVYFL